MRDSDVVLWGLWLSLAALWWDVATTLSSDGSWLWLGVRVLLWEFLGAVVLGLAGRLEEAVQEAQAARPRGLHPEGR